MNIGSFHNSTLNIDYNLYDDMSTRFNNFMVDVYNKAIRTNNKDHSFIKKYLNIGAKY